MIASRTYLGTFSAWNPDSFLNDILYSSLSVSVSYQVCLGTNGKLVCDIMQQCTVLRVHMCVRECMYVCLCVCFGVVMQHP